MNLDINGYEIESPDDSYCQNCDTTFRGDYVTIPVGDWQERYACPNCHYVEPRLHFSDVFYDLGLYLLEIADQDTWPETSYLPPYEP